ncbi:hypothetical protein VTL71DRAFT_2230 [Oculimacula yallundae]|uniref:Protein kinase domain-containing protein n=1 Tax=Oculimacula yallundae TaxID=86028 RepID=A0ABR4C8A5_9HELO
MEVAGLALAIVATTDLCMKRGKTLVDICASFKNAGTDIDERLLCVKSHWKRTSVQLDFLRKIWETLDDDHRDIQTQILQVLIRKLDLASCKLERLFKPKTGQAYQSAAEVKRWKYALVKESLNETIQDLASWQNMFDPSWFLILRISNPLIDKELRRDDSILSVLSNSVEFRSVVREDAIQQKSIFLPKAGVNFLNMNTIPFSSARCVQRTNSDKELARKLSGVDHVAFGILQCQGVIRATLPGSTTTTTFDFIFKLPPPLGNRPKTLRSHLILDVDCSLTDRVRAAKQLAKSVSYIHALGFVHKNIRPETVLVFPNGKDTLGSTYLAGFQNFRMTDGRTRLLGDSDWQKNLYRHPQRQGESLQTEYTMQHDIYSLGVCLLELGMWTSLVSYEDDTTGPVPAAALRISLTDVALKRPVHIKEHLVALAKARLPARTGKKYQEIVFDCLTCLDPENVNFGNPEEFEDEDGISVGVRYIEKILLKLDEIVV